MSVNSVLRAAALSCATLLVSGLSQAAIVTYEFEDINGYTGDFSFDDVNATPVATTPWGVGQAYTAISFTFNGQTAAVPQLVVINNHQSGNEFALFYDQATDFYIGMANAGHALFTSNALSEMSDRSLSDFSLGAYYEAGSSPTSVVSLHKVTAVPEPEGYALMLAGLAALGAAARRRKA